MIGFKVLKVIYYQLYIDARYPGEFGLLPHGKPSLKETMEFHDLAIEIFTTTKKILV